MKVKELKELLSNLPDDMDVVGNNLENHGISYPHLQEPRVDELYSWGERGYDVCGLSGFPETKVKVLIIS